MLEHIRHRHFAKKLFRPWGESRLLCFADDKKQRNAEEGPESQKAGDVESGVGRTIESIQQSIRLKSSETRLLSERLELIDKLTLYSPAVEAALGSTALFDALDSEKLAQFVEKTEDETDEDLARTRLYPERIAAAISANTEARKVFDAILEEKLRKPENIIVLTGILEQRSVHYKQLTERIENAVGLNLDAVTIDRLEALDTELRTWADDMADQHGGVRPELHNLEAWLATKSAEEIAEKLQIPATLKLPTAKDVTTTASDDPDVLAALRGVENNRFSVESGKDVDDDGNATKENLIRRIENAREREHVRQYQHVHDTGDVSAESTYKSGTVESLDANILQLKQHLDEHLQLQARDLAKYYLENSKKLQDRYGSLENAAEELGYSAEVFDFKIADNLAALSQVTRESEDDALLLPEHDENNAYLIEAQNRIHQMNEMQELKDRQAAIAEQDGEEAGDAFFEEEFIGELQDEAIDTLTWVEDNIVRLRDVAKIIEANPEVASIVQDLFGTNLSGPKADPTVEDFITSLPNLVTNLEKIVEHKNLDAGELTKDALIAFLDRNKRKHIEQLLPLLEQPERAQMLQKQISSFNSVDTKAVDIEQLKDNIGAAKENLLTKCPVLENPASKRLGVKEMIGDRCRQLENSLERLLDPERKQDPAHKDVLLRETTVELERLKETYELLMRLDENHPQSRIKTNVSAAEIQTIQGSADTLATYSHDTHEVYLQAGASEELKQHEIGHAIVDTIARQTGILPELFADLGAQLREPMSEDDDTTREQMLLRLVDRWGYTNVRTELIDRNKGQYDEEMAVRLADRKILEMMQEELVMKHLDWEADKSSGVDLMKKYNQTERELFEWLDGLGYSYKHTLDVPEALKREGNEGSVKQSVAAANVQLTNDDDDVTGAPKAKPSESVRDFNQELREIERDIANFRAFLKVYPEYKSELGWFIDEIEQAYTIYIKDPYNADTKGMSSDELDARNVEIGKKIDKLNDDHMSRAKAFIKEVDASKMDMRNAETSGSGITGILRNVRWVSIMDVVNTFKQAGEDIARMWKRRGESAQAKLGEFLTGWIPENKIYGLEYFGRLKKEFNRRNKASEIEEVNQWKEALKDGDSFELQELLRSTRNKDQVRAIIELLAERGRLDWNDVGFMKTLSALSQYNMPIEACLRDDILRDKWYNLIIVDIFGDKEHYFNWRRQNDNNIASKKKEFTDTADQLSNVSGGLSSELYRILRLYTETKEAGGSMPQEVSPHLYEEIIDYSIRNGKMTMEDKFYFLVQGIRYGLLSIDRLRTMAGENGGILNIFPFIDYFYGKNNSLADIEALGKRLEEGTGSPEKRFKPGLKTTMFVRMEVAREQRVQERLKKGVGKQGENIDHDDIPYFLPELDQSGIKEWLSTLSGNRQKLSKEALKNGYVGFSMKFKTFAALAEMDRQGLKKFSKADARNLAQTIGSYVLFDNILTRNAYDNYLQRPELSAFEYDQSTVMGLGGKSVGDYRNESLNPFVSGILRDFMTNADWQALGTTQQEFFDVEPGKNVGEEKRAKELFYKSDAFVSRIESAILQNPSRFVERLRSAGPGFMVDGVAQGFTNENIMRVQREWASRGQSAA